MQELSVAREMILDREGSHRAEAGDRGRVAHIDHDLRVLWDLRRRKLAVGAVSLREDYYDDHYTVDPGSDDPGR